MTSTLSSPLRLQTASDIHRDGLGVELVDETGTVHAEVFRSDRERTVVVTTFHDVPLNAIEGLVRFAHERLDPFENGMPLSSATNFGKVLVTK